MRNNLKYMAASVACTLFAAFLMGAALVQAMVEEAGRAVAVGLQTAATVGVALADTQTPRIIRKNDAKLLAPQARIEQAFSTPGLHMLELLPPQPRRPFRRLYLWWI